MRVGVITECLSLSVGNVKCRLLNMLSTVVRKVTHITIYIYNITYIILPGILLLLIFGGGGGEGGNLNFYR